MFEGEILCLLGHNGAGKTTTLSMLSGMLAPSGGTAFVNGLDIRHDIAAIRKSMGFCPQHDALYGDLSVAEHLRFYGRLRGLRGSHLEEEVDRKIAEVGLGPKKNVRSASLSGGMKRKLSLAVALIGDSRVVFLDEPTSGMDPFARRFIWELLKRSRQNRTIILTTHFMDEADTLGDRIAIMAEGQVCCCGSSMFLKKRYGAGYTLTAVKKDDDSANIKGIVEKAVADSNIVSDVGTELSFQLPESASGKFASLFRQLDRADVKYGISVTTLEEVFLKVAELKSLDEIRKSRKLAKSLSFDNAGSGDDVVLAVAPERIPAPDAQRFLQGASPSRQCAALLQKRLRYARRDWRNLACNILLPVVFAFDRSLHTKVWPSGQR